MSMCRVISSVVGRWYLLWPVRSLGKTLLAFALFHFCTSRPNLPITSDISWVPTFAFQTPIMKRTSFLGVSSRRSCRSFIEPFNFSFFSISGWGIDLDYSDTENVLSWKQTKIILFLRLHPSTAFWTVVAYEGYSISSKGFLSTVVDIMIIWVKFTHSSPF